MRRYRGAGVRAPSNFPLVGGGRGGGRDTSGRTKGKELREVEVKMARADGAKIGPLFAF